MQKMVSMVNIKSIITLCKTLFIVVVLLHIFLGFLGRERALKINPTVVSVSDDRIPRRIHQIFLDGSDIPGVFVPWIKTWLEKHPDWEYWLWTDKDIEKMLHDKMPGSRFLDMYKTFQERDKTMFPRLGDKTNPARYAILYFFGGFYVDMDMSALKTFDDFVLDNECLLTQESLFHSEFKLKTRPFLATCFFGCKPGTAFLKHVIESIHQDKLVKQCLNNHRHCAGTQNNTGPFYFTRTYESFMNSYIGYGKTVKHNVTLLPPEYFNPTFDRRQHVVRKVEKACQNPSSGVGKSLCDHYHQHGNKPTSAAYADHHWYDSQRTKSQILLWFYKKYNIMDIVPKKNLYIYRYL